MKYAVSNEQYKFFEKQNYLELESILTPSMLLSLQQGIRSAFLQKLACSSREFEKMEVVELLQHGHDLWRYDSIIKKVIVSLSGIASELTFRKSLRLGYDQWIAPIPSSKSYLKENPYASWLEKKAKLSEMSCVQGIACGVILCLNAGVEQPDDRDTIFPCNPGDATYFSAEKEVDFSKLHQRQGGQFLLIAYAENKALYAMRAHDPYVHEWKRLGYVFGERLNDQLHPIVYRKS